MVTLFSLIPSSSSSPSSFLSHSTFLKPLHLLKSKPSGTLHFNRPQLLRVNSSLGPTTPLAVQTFWKWLSDEKVVSSKSPEIPGIVPEGLLAVPMKRSYAKSFEVPANQPFPAILLPSKRCNTGLQDEKLKEGGNLDTRLEIAVGIRAGEKRVLQQIDEIFREREQELDEYEYYQERRLRDLGLVGEQGEIIFWEPK